MVGIGQQSGQIRQNLMDHLSARVPLRRIDFPFRGPPSTSGIESFRDGEFRRTRAGFRVSLNNDGWSRKGTPYADIVDLVTNQKVIGADLQAHFFERVTKQVRFSCSVEVSPDPNNKVELSSTLKDF